MLFTRRSRIVGRQPSISSAAAWVGGGAPAGPPSRSGCVLLVAQIFRGPTGFHPQLQVELQPPWIAVGRLNFAGEDVLLGDLLDAGWELGIAFDRSLADA